MVQHRKRVHAHAEPGGVHAGQPDHAGRGERDPGPALAIVPAHDRLGAVHHLRQVHVLGQQRRTPVAAGGREHAARVARLRGGGEPPLLVHQVQREHALERDAGRLGDPAHLLQEIRRVPFGGGDESGGPDQIGDEVGRRPAEPRSHVGVPPLEQPGDPLAQRLAVSAAAAPPAVRGTPRSHPGHRHEPILPGRSPGRQIG